MSDDFNNKLEAYEKGQLHGEELTDFEKELEKLEQYQEHLDGKKSMPAIQINENKQKKILKRSKWKARFQTALTALGIFILVMIVSSMLTAVYYSWGKPDRGEVFAKVIDYTLAVTEPDGDFGGTSTNVKPFFGAEMSRDLKKKVGDNVMKVGELKVNFLFSLMSFPERNYLGNVSENPPLFSFPGFERGMSDWNRLEKLPEGTVVSAYVSFNKLESTDEVFQLLGEKDFDISWFAVDTGVEGQEEHGAILDPIGFPSTPIWHEDDMKLDSREETKGFLFGKTVSEGYSSPSYQEGDSDMLHNQFLKTLRFLEKHEKMANKLYLGHNLNLEDKLQYLKKNGIKHYGVVITGPTKEILKLKNEKAISTIEVDEVGLWNWQD
ncbi:anti-sigma factor [Bacillus sp. FJAT-49732]|uniref:Anti-sigma factor n=1 Tax=Lederbergia citrisecunda TaxID=2833583 RepID=A0A942TSA3_9BACI|nr:anti-sigma factor [Lederbergia citrisecunda]MBS4200909.1 anti-sigma factor [Lederbergia citrisecunda]